MSEHKSYLDTFSEHQKPESFNEETFVAVKDKRRLHRIFITIVLVAVLIAGILLVFNRVNTVQVPDLAGMTIEEANIWATKNRIVLVVKKVYNFANDEGAIISQEAAAGTSIGKNSTLSIEVSLGADPEEAITWPDIKTMTTSEIETWISDNKLTGVKIVTANSNIVEANHVISYSLTDGTESDFQRKSRATVNVSIGPVEVSDTVVMTDFSSMKAVAILQWGTDNGVTIVLSEAFDDYVAAGSVVSQSVKANTEIVKTEPVTVVISLGKQVIVPDFSSMTPEEASVWAKQNNVTLTVQQKYSSTAKGVLLEQATAAGSSIKGGDEIFVTYSLGKVELASFVGKTKLDILNWQTTINSQGGNIKLTFSNAYGSKGTVGKIISQSNANDYVSPGTTVNVIISLGMKLLAPDFSGKTEDECTALAQAAGVAVIFDYKGSSSAARGYVISQNPAKDTVMTDADTITVLISTSDVVAAKVTVPNLNLLTRDQAAAWARTNNITLTIEEKYSNNYAAGLLFDQSVTSGSQLAQGSGMTVTCSLGKIAISSFIGRTKLDMLSWLDSVNSKGASLSVNYTYANNKSYAMNIIIGQSIMNTYINAGTTITFDISWDPDVP